MGDSSYYELHSQPPNDLLQECRMERGVPDGPCYPTTLLVMYIISLTIFITI